MMDGWKERRDLGLKILSESRVRVIITLLSLLRALVWGRRTNTGFAWGVLGVDAAWESSPGPVSCYIEHLLRAGCLTQVIPFILLIHSLSLQKKKARFREVCLLAQGQRAEPQS